MLPLSVQPKLLSIFACLFVPPRSLCIDALIELSDENADWKLNFDEFLNCLKPGFNPPEKSELKEILWKTIKSRWTLAVSKNNPEKEPPDSFLFFSLPQESEMQSARSDIWFGSNWDKVHRKRRHYSVSHSAWSTDDSCGYSRFKGKCMQTYFWLTTKLLKKTPVHTHTLTIFCRF